MSDVNLIPDDYIRDNETRRTNIICLVLFVPVLAVLTGLFLTIKVQQRVLTSREKLVDAKMAKAHEAIKQFEQLQAKRDEMWKRVMTAAELLEPVSRSVLLASLTNNLPSGVSLLQLSAVQKEQVLPRSQKSVAKTSKYAKKRAKKKEAAAAQPPEKRVRMYIDIEGIAPSDIEVAAYIERLGSSKLLEDVTLVESREHETEDATFRQFRLTAMLRKDIHLTDEDIEEIRAKL